MVWKCKQCGDCCKFISFEAVLTEDQKEWLNAHEGIKVVGNRVVISAQCKWLHRVGDHYTCDLHATNKKPTICKKAGKRECKLAQELVREL